MPNKTIVVLTTDMIRFEIEAAAWTTEYKSAGEDSDLALVTRLYATGQAPVAEFKDVHAIWIKGAGDIIPPEEDE